VEKWGSMLFVHEKTGPSSDRSEKGIRGVGVLGGCGAALGPRVGRGLAGECNGLLLRQHVRGAWTLEAKSQLVAADTATANTPELRAP
jgi:hypothetical protein